MCGGILLGNCAQNRSPALASLAYNVGRILSYTAIGGIFGALGTVTAYSMSVKSMVFTMVGLAVILIGLNLWGLLPGLGALIASQPSFCQLPTQTQKCFAGRPLLIGLLTGLMPCASLYAMWLHAVSGGSAAYGAESMLAFALGTAPLLFLFGALGALIPKKWNKYFLKASAVLVTAMGLKMLITGLRML
jgi:sulfite exporter TauE/SafE